MVSKKEKRELEEIRRSTNLPKNEEKIVPLIVQKNKIKDKKTKKVHELIQYKVAIPKKFVDILKLNKDKNKAHFVFHKEENKLTMEIING